ncbi:MULTISPECIES: acetyl-CoA hydrolase/transferase family protein [Diaphorobacter]|uniref:Succinyl-CoA:acetate CoA-transferase n=2 Tax=Diaphorobacter TaxID=238749 RepID=A0AAX1WX47_9BURK|nr:MULTISPECIES: acetyl-CoA hydrolase/transferase family protein [unclassified Diaphorobacter]ROR49067.1 succinyl-CoA:acetate CoA-transferase [Diaphorobacter nitroreducens]
MSTSSSPRIQHPGLAQKIMSAAEAAALIPAGANIGMSGFTGAGYPKQVPQALAARIEAEHAAGRPFQVNVWTGASTAPELDGALAKVNGIHQRLPFQSDPICRDKINAGEVHYLDIHLSHVAQHAWFGFLGPMQVAVVEVLGILPDGRLIPSSAVGNNKTWLEIADKVILEVNSLPPIEMEGMHDIYYGTAIPPRRQPIHLTQATERIGEPYLRVDPSKVIAVVQTHQRDRDTAFAKPDAVSNQIAAHIIDFLAHEVKVGRLPKNMLPLQSGVGNVANAVLTGLLDGPFDELLGFTEVLQDGMLELIKRGKMTAASATAISLSSEALKDFNEHIAFYRDRIVLRPQEISNHPELVRRLGVIAMNAMIEADIYGNINSTHVMGSAMMNGIGGSGDYARNGYLSFFVTPSVAKGGKVSCIVPMVSHVDHTEHDTQIIVTEQGLADLRGLSPRQRAQVIIDKCAHPDFRPLLQDYFDRARSKGAQHTPHILGEALSWHERCLATGSMLP